DRSARYIRPHWLRLSFRRTGLIRRRPFNALAHHSHQMLSQLVGHFKRAETGNGPRRIEVPRILRKPDEVADLWIGRPSAAKRRTGQVGGYAWGEKGTDIGVGGDRFDRRKFCYVKCSLGRLGRAAHHRRRIAPLAWLFAGVCARRGFRLFRGVAFTPRPARDEIFRFTHSRAFRIGPRRASASGSGRSRSRLWNGCSM